MESFLNLKGCIIIEKRIRARCFSAKFDRFLTDYLPKASVASTIRRYIKDITVHTQLLHFWLFLNLQE